MIIIRCNIPQIINYHHSVTQLLTWFGTLDRQYVWKCRLRFLLYFQQNNRKKEIET